MGINDIAWSQLSLLSSVSMHAYTYLHESPELSNFIALDPAVEASEAIAVCYCGQEHEHQCRGPHIHMVIRASSRELDALCRLHNGRIECVSNYCRPQHGAQPGEGDNERLCRAHVTIRLGRTCSEQDTHTHTHTHTRARMHM